MSGNIFAGNMPSWLSTADAAEVTKALNQIAAFNPSEPGLLTFLSAFSSSANAAAGLAAAEQWIATAQNIFAFYVQFVCQLYVAGSPETTPTLAHWVAYSGAGGYGGTA